MSIFGYIRTFNRLTGTGFIAPEMGGAMVPFSHLDLTPSTDIAIEEGARVRYELGDDALGGKLAVRMHLA